MLLFEGDEVRILRYEDLKSGKVYGTNLTTHVSGFFNASILIPRKRNTRLHLLLFGDRIIDTGILDLVQFIWPELLRNGITIDRVVASPNFVYQKEAILGTIHVGDLDSAIIRDIMDEREIDSAEAASPASFVVTGKFEFVTAVSAILEEEYDADPARIHKEICGTT